MIAKCPKNESHKDFFTTAHVVQDWKVDEYGNFLEEVSTSEVTHGPNKDNCWTCAICNAEAIVED